MFRFLFDLPATMIRRPHPNDGRARVCDRFADIEVQNQFGSLFRFHRDFVGGRMLVINTMYTECRGSCPTTGQTLQWLRKQLSPGLGAPLMFLSISLDPEVDTPEKLHEYAKPLGANTQDGDLCPWFFLTGRKDDIESLRKSLGFYDLNPTIDADITRHDATLLFGNCDLDRWSTLPAQLRRPLLVEGVRRILGSTLNQRFGFKI